MLDSIKKQMVHPAQFSPNKLREISGPVKRDPSCEGAKGRKNAAHTAQVVGGMRNTWKPVTHYRIRGFEKIHFIPPADTSLNARLLPPTADPQSPATPPTPPHSKKARHLPDPGSSPTPPYSAPRQAAVPSPVTRRIAGKSKPVAPTTSAAASLPPSAQTCTPQPICPPSQSRAGSANKPWLAMFSPLVTQTLLSVIPSAPHKCSHRFRCRPHIQPDNPFAIEPTLGLVDARRHNSRP